MFTLPSRYQIRPMRVSDLDQVLAIDLLSFPTPTKEKLYVYELTENELSHYDCLIAHDQIIGYVGYWVMGDEVHISTIATHPDWRGKGLGELLLLYLLLSVYQQPITMVTLEVRRSNLVAQALYHKYQFELVGERPRYYRDTGEDALIMTRSPLDAPYLNWLESQTVRLLARLSEA
ncbi:MAG: ribosomal-protein-alanine N-acetyltransferase [Chloroflexi bacterium]|nr:MAG: ribosomal-protein-alanine N-acetyltransferase [Chloroflexota bacterium]